MADQNNDAKEPEKEKEGTPPQEVEANPPAPEMPTVPEGQQAYALHVEGLQSALKSVVTMTERMGKLLPLMGEHSQHQKQTSEALVTLGSSVDAMAAATKYVISNVTQSSQNEKEMVNTLRDLRWLLGGENKKLVNSSLKKVAIDLSANLEAAMKQISEVQVQQFDQNQKALQDLTEALQGVQKAIQNQSDLLMNVWTQSLPVPPPPPAETSGLDAKEKETFPPGFHHHRPWSQQVCQWDRSTTPNVSEPPTGNLTTQALSMGFAV